MITKTVISNDVINNDESLHKLDKPQLNSPTNVTCKISTSLAITDLCNAFRFPPTTVTSKDVSTSTHLFVKSEDILN